MRQLGRTAPVSACAAPAGPNPQPAPGLPRPWTRWSLSLSSSPRAGIPGEGQGRPLRRGNSAGGWQRRVAAKGAWLGGGPLLWETAGPEPPAASASVSLLQRLGRGQGTHPANIPVAQNHSRLRRRHGEGAPCLLGLETLRQRAGALYPR